MSLCFYIIDLETTGLKPGWHETVEISIIRCSDRNQLTRQIKAEFPERASEQSLEITGRTIADIIKGEKKEDVVKIFNDFFFQDGLTPEHRCMIGHNSSFDKNFSHALWKSVDQMFPAVCWIDTIKLSKEWALQLGQKPENYKLHSVLKFANIKPSPGLHSAESDSRNTYLLWRKILENKVDYLKSIKRFEHKLI